MFSGGGMDDIFASMFGAGGDMGMGDDFDDFIHILEGDNMRSFSGLFSNLGKNYRGGGGGRGPKKNARAAAASNSKAGKKRRGGGEEEMLDEMMMAIDNYLDIQLSDEFKRSED